MALRNFIIQFLLIVFLNVLSSLEMLQATALELECPAKLNPRILSEAIYEKRSHELLSQRYPTTFLDLDLEFKDQDTIVIRDLRQFLQLGILIFLNPKFSNYAWEAPNRVDCHTLLNHFSKVCKNRNAPYLAHYIYPEGNWTDRSYLFKAFNHATAQINLTQGLKDFSEQIIAEMFVALSFWHPEYVLEPFWNPVYANEYAYSKALPYINSLCQNGCTMIAKYFKEKYLSRIQDFAVQTEWEDLIQSSGNIEPILFKTPGTIPPIFAKVSGIFSISPGKSGFLNSNALFSKDNFSPTGAFTRLFGEDTVSEQSKQINSSAVCKDITNRNCLSASEGFPRQSAQKKRRRSFSAPVRSGIV